MSEFQTYILYYLIIFFTSILAALFLRQSRMNKITFWLIVIPPVLISGFRFGVGVDYFSYVEIYYRLTSNNIIDNILNTRYEPSWILLNHLVKLIFNDVKYVFILSSFLFIFFSFKAIKDNKNYLNLGIAVLIFMTTMYNQSFNIVRFSVAASIIMLTVQPMLNRKFIRYLMIVLFASSFHYSALFFLPSYWIVNSKVKMIGFAKKVIAIILSILVLVFAQPIMSIITSFGMFESYDIYNEVNYNDIGMGILILSFPVILIYLLNRRKLIKYNNEMRGLIVLFIIGIILNYLGYIAEYVNRVAIYYELMQVFIISAILNVQKNKNEKIIYLYIIILYYVALFTYKIILNNAHKTIPYIF